MNELENIRSRIDRIDTEIIALLHARMCEAEKVAHYKKDNNLPPLQSHRWNVVLEHIQHLATENNLDPEYVKNIWDIIHEYTLRTEERILS